MYLVTKRIEFCYGHRLLDYDGVCKHPHGHNAVVEVDVRTDRLDNRNMVADFSDIKRIVTTLMPSSRAWSKISLAIRSTVGLLSRMYIGSPS